MPVKTLTGFEKAGAFCRGIIRGSPLVEVSVAALAKGAEGEERLLHIGRIAEGGSCEQIAGILSEVSSGHPYRGVASIPEDLQKRLAEGYVRASEARRSHGSLASSPFMLTSLASTAVVTLGLFTGGAVPLVAAGVGMASAVAAKKIPEAFERKRAEDREKASSLSMPLCEPARLALERMKP
jgi:hypothetical protein